MWKSRVHCSYRIEIDGRVGHNCGNRTAHLLCGGGELQYSADEGVNVMEGRENGRKGGGFNVIKLGKTTATTIAGRSPPKWNKTDTPPPPPPTTYTTEETTATTSRCIQTDDDVEGRRGKGETRSKPTTCLEKEKTVYNKKGKKNRQDEDFKRAST